LARLTKMPGRVGYVLVDRVVVEPSAAAPERIQIWGVFTAADPSGEATYSAPRRGYLYAWFPPDRPMPAWEQWQPVAGTPRLLRFVSFPWKNLRIRPAEESLSGPDEYSLMGPFPVRTDSTYSPIQSLLAFQKR